MTERQVPAPIDRKAVAEALDRTKLLNAAAKRHWRTLLPHLGDADLRELWQILAETDEKLRSLDAPRATPSDTADRSDEPAR
jgi:hypothetical protein